MKQRTVTLGELAAEGALEIGAGRPRSEDPSLPVLRVADVLDGRLQTLRVDVGSRALPVAGRKSSRPGDVVLTTKGTVGRVAIVPPGGPTYAYSPQICYFRSTDSELLVARYLYYWFRSDEFWQQAAHLKSQTDMADFISLQDVESLRIALPPCVDQQAIADVLGALDDKIAANAKVQELALDLCDSVFAAASSNAHHLTTFEAIADVAGGGTPKTAVEQFWNGDVRWATPTDVTALESPYLFETGRTISADGLASCASRLYPVGSILMTSRATIGAFAIAKHPTAVNQGFIVVNAREPHLQWWLFHDMRRRVPEFLSHANGATFLELSRGKFKQLPISLPKSEAAASFSAAVGPLHAKNAHLSVEGRRLTATRDALLPLLMSGKLRVKDAEKVVSDAV